jgi:hypothetical protein
MTATFAPMTSPIHIFSNKRAFRLSNFSTQNHKDNITATFDNLQMTYVVIQQQFGIIYTFSCSHKYKWHETLKATATHNALRQHHKKVRHTRLKRKQKISLNYRFIVFHVKWPALIEQLPTTS